MKDKLGMWIWLGILAVVLMGGAGVGYKFYRWKKARTMMMWEAKVTLGSLQENVTEEQIKEAVESLTKEVRQYEVLRPVIDKLNLQEKWGLETVEATMSTLQERVSVRHEDGQLNFVVADPDQELAGNLRREVIESLQNVRRLRRYGLPVLTP